MSARKNAYAASRAKANGTMTTEKSSVIFWILVVFTGLFMFWAPFQRALFNGGTFDFERSIYSGSVWSSIILLLIAILAFFVFKLKEHKDVLTILVLIIPLTYVISLSNAASHYLATNMVYIQMLYATFFILGVFLTKNKLGTSIVASLLMISGYFIVVFGLFYWLGNGNFAGTVVGWFAFMDGTNPTLYRDAVMVDSNGYRLTSVFQYANTYAAFLIMLSLAALFYIVKSRKWLSILPHAFLIVPVLVSFWLTLSRGAIVVIPVIFLIMLFFFSISRQILALLQFGLAFITSLLILQKVTDIGIGLQKQPSASESWHGWSILLIASVVFTVVAIVIQLFVAPWLERITARLEAKKYATFILPVAAIVVGVIGAILILSDTGFKNILPENVKTRIENINFQQHSVLERGTFYVDAVKLWSDYPIIGAGGGAWASLYEKYQNNPYTSRQAHNFFLQYLVEVGALGFLIFVGFVLAVFIYYIRSYIRNKESRDLHFLFFIVTISLLIHSMIDFDLSYVYLGAILFLALGGMLSNASSAPLRLKSESMAVHKSFPALLAVLSIVMFYISAQLVSANSSYKQTLQVIKTSQDYNTIVKPLDEAISLHPAHPDYVLTGQVSRIGILLQVYNQMQKEDPAKAEPFFTQAQDLLNQLLAKEPHNRIAAMQQLNMYLIKGKHQEALDWSNAQIPNYPWYTEMYEKSISLNIDLANQASAKNNIQEYKSRLDSALATYQQVLDRVESLKNLPKEQAQGREFAVTPNMALYVGQINYMRGDYAAAAATIQPHIKDNLDDQTNRGLIRWYLAALQKDGKQDQALLNNLIAKDPAEKQNIEAIVATNFPK
ncbi:O-antigen ligase family protein [Bacillus sp. 3255]|uniref:O-antigen ligase family protein n=1 Tax=Bacillus sp. 3255 TaxID=2817904 RepID=UPI002863A2B2|nr:O-antigen ligase family protein [Bacillus sp. 3255]MDR6878746.1 thioredoxin-like negative regulator of GroEL [Bacillus sp. 3255]